MTEARVATREPAKIDLEAGTYYWCRCRDAGLGETDLGQSTATRIAIDLADHVLAAADLHALLVHQQAAPPIADRPAFA